MPAGRKRKCTPTPPAPIMPEHDDPTMIRVRRILEYVGPSKWVHGVLAASKVTRDKPVRTPRGVIAEVGLVEFAIPNGMYLSRMAFSEGENENEATQ